jgi:large subunit ribosomal protein L10
MNRDQKSVVVNGLRSQLSAAPFVLLTEFRGTTVADVTRLRRELEKNGMRFQVVKNTLARRALGAVGVTGLDPHLKGMTGIVMSSPDGVGSARVLRDVLKPYNTIQVRAGFFDGTVITADPVKVVSEMPGREELLASLLGTLQAGPQQLVSVLAAPGRDLVQLLANYANKLEESANQAAAS